MKTYPECLPCLLKQAIQAAALSGADEAKQKMVADNVEEFLKSAKLSDSPPKTSRDMHVLIRSLLSDPDPYHSVKDKYNKLALLMRPQLERVVRDSFDPLETAIRVAIAGNVIDFGTHHKIDLANDVNDVLKKKFAVFDFEALKEELSMERDVLFLGDNTGEVVFDAILLEEINRRFGSRIKYAVKTGPILNDATYEDAIFAGIDRHAEIIDSGANSPGIVPEYASEEFRQLLKSSRLIISKGQGNFETLNTLKLPIFFMLKLKCPVVASYSNMDEGSILLMRSRV